MPEIRKRYLIIVIDTGEEIDIREEAYRNLVQDFKEGSVPTQVSFADTDGRQYIEQRSGIRMREFSEVVY